MSPVSQFNWSANLLNQSVFDLNPKIRGAGLSIVEQAAISEPQNPGSGPKTRPKISSGRKPIRKMKSNTKITIISLTSKNYHKWIKEIQDLVVRANVWKYVDLQDTKQKPTNGECPDVSDYAVSMKSIITIRFDQDSVLRIRSIRDFNELFAAQKESLKINIVTWELKKKRINKIAKDMQIVDNAIKISARSYIPSDEMTSSCRDIIRMLAARYKLTRDQIIEQIQNECYDAQWSRSILIKILMIENLISIKSI
jgi:hypothetical protein